MIPRRIHFLFGLANDYGGIPFSLYHLIAIKSAKLVNPGYDVVLHYYNEPPNNPLWEEAKSITINHRLESVPTHFGDRPIHHMAHKADAVRMDILWESGGIYLDMDTICIKSFEPLLDKKVVMAMEIANGYVSGLCNAVMLTEPKSEFFRIWRERYNQQFDSGDWNGMSVRYPFQLAQQRSDLIHVLPSEAFFRTTWFPEDIRDTHERTIAFDRSYCLHLWETLTYHPVLKNLTREDIMNRDSSYNVLARSALMK
jgi:hypothetical protein